jgi:pimeloyl-ACP methyl ester carboxylesterase
MSRTRAISSMLAALCMAAQILPAQAGLPKLVDVGGHKLNVQIAGTSKPGAPTVVFEAGLGSPLAGWNGINVTVADSVRTVAYDRAGIGASQPGTEPPTVKHIVAELHTLLGKVGAPPPYVLVGHSLGGPIINLFAATYPKEVVGLVYIDPTDFTQTDADMNAVWEKVGVKNGRDSLRKMMAQMLSGAPAGIVAEWREQDRVERGGFVEFRAAGEAPDIPMVVLLAAKPEPLPPGVAFPGDQKQYVRAVLEQRIDHFGRLTARAAKGMLVLTTRSSHFLHATEPELAVWGIRRVLSWGSPHPELERFVGQYPLAPGFTIAIMREDDKLLIQATGQPAFAMAAESPTSFSIKMVGAVIEFETDPTGQVTGLVLVQNGMRQRAPKAK